MQQRGFTLIELIIVIVILGILAVTAAPRFIDLQSDATASTLQGVRATLQSSSQLVYAKSAIAGEQTNASVGGAASQVSINGQAVETDFGYPDGELITQAALNAFADLSTADWTLTVGAGSAATASPKAGDFGIAPTGKTPDYAITTETGASCHVVYQEAIDANSSPVVTVVSGGC